MNKWTEITQEEFSRMVFDTSKVETIDINVDPLHITEYLYGKHFKSIRVTDESGTIGSSYASTTTYSYYKKK